MPDMQTALTKALSTMNQKEMTHINNLLNHWSEAEIETKPEATTMTTSSPSLDKRFKNNVTRSVFEFVKNTPGATKRQLAVALSQDGFKETSTVAIAAQLVRRGILRQDGEKLYHAVENYSSSTKYSKRNRKTKRVTTQRVVAKPVAAVAAVAPSPARFDPKAVIGPLTVYQARELYDELKRMFGG